MPPERDSHPDELCHHDGSDTDRRGVEREPRGNPVRVYVTDPCDQTISFDGHLVNMGYGGALVNSETYLEPGQDCQVTILGSTGYVVTDREPGTVRWVRQGHGTTFVLGIEFASPRFRIIK